MDNKYKAPYENFKTWKNIDSHCIDCVHVYKFRKQNDMHYIVCYKCRSKIGNSAQEKIEYPPPPDIEEFRNKDRYILSKFEKDVCARYEEKIKKSTLQGIGVKRDPCIGGGVPKKKVKKLYKQPARKSHITKQDPIYTELIYSNGAMRSQIEVMDEQKSLPDVKHKQKEKIIRDPNYKYIVNPRNMYEEMIKSGQLEKPKFLNKPPPCQNLL